MTEKFEQLNEDEVKILDIIIEKSITIGSVNPNDLPPLSADYFSRAKEIKSKEYSHHLKILKTYNIVDIDTNLDGSFIIRSIPYKTKKFYDEGGFKAIYARAKRIEAKEKELDHLTLEKLKWDLQISKFQSKTKWWPLFISIISLIISIVAILIS